MQGNDKRIICTLIIAISFVFSEFRRPKENDILNYVHILFEWDQEPDSDYYQIQVDTSITFITPILDDTTSLTIFIDLKNINWNSTYFCRVRSVYGNMNSNQNWLDTLTFQTKEKIMEDVNVSIYNDSLIQEGITIFSGFQPTLQSAAFDKNGRQVWNENDFAFRLSDVNEFGSMYGWSNIDFPNYTGVKINTDIQILSPPFNLQLDDHAFIELSNGNFLSFTYENRLGPIPSNNIATEQFRSLGYIADDITEEFQWRGHIITEWDPDLNIVWTWNSFDYFTLKDFDNYGPTWLEAYNNPLQYYDWMHSNSIFFDEADSIIYISVRHLSRISKIAYPSGEVIWNMGLPEPYLFSGEESLCSELLFSFQHHVQKLDNGNIIFFDNGNLSETLFDYDEPISKVFEIEVIGDSSCQVVWEYQLPYNLMGHGMGSVQILKNNNRLIFTHGSGGDIREPTIIELTESKDLVWKLTGGPSNAWYRAFRIPSIHPDAYNVIFENYFETTVGSNLTSGIFIDEANMIVSFRIYNKSGYNQPYIIQISDDEEWFSSVRDTIYIQSEDNHRYEINLDPTEDSSTNLILNIFPLHHNYAFKTYNYRILKIFELKGKNHANTLKKLEFLNPYPNPFNPIITFNYILTKNMSVGLRIYNVKGVLVKTLVNKYKMKGKHFTNWDGTDFSGLKVSSGTYFSKLDLDGKSVIKKIAFLK